MDLEQTAIQRLRAASEMALQVYKTPLVITDSGGKDSSICTHLAERAGIPFEVMHNHTTADAPETVYFIRKKFQHFKDKGIKCAVNMPVYKGKRTSMWNLIPQKLMPPTRLVRYCCSVLKERGGSGRFITTGVRWAESVKRKNSRGIYETMPSDISKNGRQSKTTTHHILLRGKHDRKRRSISQRRNHLNITALSCYDLAGKVQSYADAGLAMHFFLAVKAPKNSCLIAFRNSFTIISYFNLHIHFPLYD